MFHTVLNFYLIKNLGGKGVIRFFCLDLVFFGVAFGFQRPRASVLPSVSRVWHIRPRCLAFSQSHGAGETKQLDPRLVAIEI